MSATAGRQSKDIEFGARLKLPVGASGSTRRSRLQHLKCWTFANMLRTDIFDRASMTRLILRTGFDPNDLNVGGASG